MSRDGGGEEERWWWWWWWEGDHQMQRARDGEKDGAAGTQHSNKRGPEEDLAATASSVARLWARGQGQARKGICGVRDSAQVMCCVVAALSTGQPDQNASPASVPLTHPLPLPPPLPRPLARRLCLSLAGSARTLRGIIVKLRSTVRHAAVLGAGVPPFQKQKRRWHCLGQPLPSILRGMGQANHSNFTGGSGSEACLGPLLLAQLAACLCRSRWCRDEFVNRDRQMVFESSSGNGTVCLMTLSEAKDDTSCN
ncbi:hypothetical protein BGZ57DRAFT_1002851 [Hyaloscypha finlandica]|nr:hypothetical protein BGZ57DRAFT_1002851 [Hyaloscypha finlandica]